MLDIPEAGPETKIVCKWFKKETLPGETSIEGGERAWISDKVIRRVTTWSEGELWNVSCTSELSPPQAGDLGFHTSMSVSYWLRATLGDKAQALQSLSLCGDKGAVAQGQPSWKESHVPQVGSKSMPSGRARIQERDPRDPGRAQQHHCGESG